MSKSLRLILFLAFVFAFLITAPLLVLYTAGYRFDIMHGRIVHTAVLNISSIPSNASVFLDDQAFASGRTPAVLDTILPGRHRIVLERKDYLPWETERDFASKEAVVLQPIVLFLDASLQQQSSFQPITTQIHEHTNQFAYITQESSWIEAWVVDGRTANTRLLLRLPHALGSTYTLDWSIQGTHLALTEFREEETLLTLVDVRHGITIDLPNDLQRINTAWWDIGNNSDLYIQTDTTLTRYNLTNQSAQALPFSADHIISYAGAHVSLVRTENRAVVSFQESETVSIITFLPLGEYRFVDAPEGLIALHDASQNRYILIDPTNREQPILLNEEAQHWSWHEDGNILVYSTGFDIKHYLRSSHETQTLTRISTPIHQLMWYPSSSTLLYRTSSQIQALSLEGTTILSTTPLTNNQEGWFWIDTNGIFLHILLEHEGMGEWWSQRLQK